MSRPIATTALLASLALIAGCKGGDAPAMTLQQFMKDKVDPTSKVLFDAVQYVSDDTGNHDIVPHTDAEWERVRQAAADLQAQGKQLQDPAYTKGRNADWTKMSQDMVTVAKQVEDAAKAKNPDKVFESAGTVYSVCSGCHTVYPPPVNPVTPASSAAPS